MAWAVWKRTEAILLLHKEEDDRYDGEQIPESCGDIRIRPNARWPPLAASARWGRRRVSIRRIPRRAGTLAAVVVHTLAVADDRVAAARTVVAVAVRQAAAEAMCPRNSSFPCNPGFPFLTIQQNSRPMVGSLRNERRAIFGKLEDIAAEVLVFDQSRPGARARRRRPPSPSRRRARAR